MTKASDDAVQLELEEYVIAQSCEEEPDDSQTQNTSEEEV